MLSSMHKTMVIFGTLTSIVILSHLSEAASGGRGQKSTTAATPKPTVGRARRLPYADPLIFAKLNSVHDQLERLKNSSYSVIILDPQDSNLDHDQIMELRQQNRTVLAYVSVGVADTTKPYWRPQWTGGFFPDFVIQTPNVDLPSGKYWVQYWKAYWQRMLMRYIQEQVLTLGYSGLLLDNLDVYRRYQNPDIEDGDEMVAFIQTIKDQAQQFYKDTKIFVANVTELYSADKFRKLVDGLLTENLWFENETDLFQKDKSKVDQMLVILQQAQRDGKIILSIDYSSNQSEICAFYERCSSQGFLCTVTDEKLTSEPRICAPKTATVSNQLASSNSTHKPANGQSPFIQSKYTILFGFLVATLYNILF